MNKVELKASARVMAAEAPYGGSDRVRSLEVKLQNFLRKNPGNSDAKSLLDSLNSGAPTPAQMDDWEGKAKTICKADAGEDHWINQVRGVLRLARGGKGAMKMSSADQENNTVTIEMKPQMYLDPYIMMKMLIIFKREGLAMVVGSHIANMVTLTVGPEGFLEDQV